MSEENHLLSFLSQIFEIGALKDLEFIRLLLISIVLVFLILLLRRILVKTISNSKLPQTELKRTWIVFIKNITTALAIAGLGIVWAKELQNFAFSIAALGAALAISFKEYILCVMGGVFKASTQLFKIGDRIEINGYRGNVTDHDFLATRLDEVGPGHHLHNFTGRNLVIPNSWFLLYTLVNETGKVSFGLHSFEHPCKRRSTDILKTQGLLLKAAQEVTNRYVQETASVFRRSIEKEGFAMPSPQPRVLYYFPNSSDVIFVIRVPAPTKRKGKVQAAILQRFIELEDQLKETSPGPNP